MSNKAALYLRSSKDRAEVSLGAQGEELKLLASKHGLEIVATFEDAVLSGSTEDRPGFQDLLEAIRARKFAHLLVYDTSRIARSILVAQVFKRECERHGVRIIYASTPVELDPITAVLFNAVYEAFDQMHSMTSKKKGLAGMRQNISKGWRAGGRAPLGYKLIHEPTGAIRDGRPVMKSKLALSDEARGVQAYLEARAAGEPRTAAMKRCGLSGLKPTTLVDLEWNALVYAGHTVWNRHTDKKTRGEGRSKRRPREEWIVQRDTHAPLISELQAEAILTQIATSKIGNAVRAARTHSSDFLLAGLLFTSDGRPWVGAGPRYRLKPTATQKGRYVDRVELDKAVTAQVRADVSDEAFVQKLTEVTRQWYPEHDPGKDLEREALKYDREAERAAKLALQTSEPAPLLQIMENKRRQAQALRQQAEAARNDQKLGNMTKAITVETVKDALSEGRSDAAIVRSLVAKVILEPDLTCRVDYLPALGRSLGMASPRGSESWAISSTLTDWRLPYVRSA